MLDAAQTHGRVGDRRLHPASAEVRQLTPLVVDALRRGWLAKDLAAALGGDLGSARTVFGALQHRLQPENLGPPPAPRPRPAPRQPARPAPASPGPVPCTTPGCADGYADVAGGRRLACPTHKRATHLIQLADAGVETFAELVELEVRRAASARAGTAA